MKKFLAIVLALLLALTLLACNKTTDDTSSPASEPASQAPATQAPASQPPASGAPAATTDDSGAFVIPAVDFRAPTDPFSRDTYKIVNLNIFQTPFGAFMDECYIQLGEKLNYTYTNLSSNADIDNFMTNIETCAAQDYDGMIIQGDFTTQDRIFDIVKENNIKFIPGLSPFVDADNNYVMSSVVMDSYDLGGDALQFMVDNFGKYADGSIDISEIGFITITFSTVTDLNARVDGALARYTELYPELVETNYFVNDTVNAGVNAITAQAAYDTVAPTVSGHPEMKGWIVFGSVEDFAAGAARALEDLGKQGVAVVTPVPSQRS
jgi:ABC-type sugar transport system substrate-binding protein